MKVYRQWLADESNNIMHMTLKDWIDVLDLTVDIEKRVFFSRKLNKVFEIERVSGYFFSVTDFTEIMLRNADKMYYVGNADLSSCKLNRDR